MAWSLEGVFSWGFDNVLLGLNSILRFSKDWADRLGFGTKYMLLGIMLIVSMVTHVIGFFTNSVVLLFVATSNITQAIGSFKSDYQNLDFGPMIQSLQLANYIFPVDETFELLILYGVFHTGLLTYRIIKSFIPTVSG